MAHHDGDDAVLDAAAFTERFTATARLRFPGRAVTTVNDFVVRIGAVGKPGECLLLLQNAYADYCADPASLRRVIDRYMPESTTSVADNAQSRPDPSTVLPVVRLREVLDEEERRLARLGRGSRYIRRRFTDVHDVLYVFDTPRHMISTAERHLRAMAVAESDVHALALSNLRREICPDVEWRWSPDRRVAMVTCGGNYETSLLLLPEVWDDARFASWRGMVAVAPSRDVLAVADESSDAALLNLMLIARDITTDCAHALDASLLIRVDGSWHVVDEPHVEP